MAAPPATFTSDGRPASASPTACILWTAGTEPPATLTDLLAGRGFRLEAATDRFSAMAAACCAAAAGQRVVVILDEPEHLNGRDELIEAVHGRLPAAVIWTFSLRRKPQLASLDVSPQRAAGSNRPPNGAVPVPLRLVGEPTDPAAPAAPAAIDPADVDTRFEDEPDGRTAILSSEELEMLLADEPERGPKR